MYLPNDRASVKLVSRTIYYVAKEIYIIYIDSIL